MSILRRILSPKQTREESEEEQPPQPSRTFSASNMSASPYNGMKDSPLPRPRSEELENVTYCKPSDYLKAADEAEKQVNTKPPEKKENGGIHATCMSDAYSDVPVHRPTNQRFTVGAVKRQQVQDEIQSQIRNKGHNRSRSIGQVMDTSEYSTPWNQVLKEREQAQLRHAPAPNQEGSEEEASIARQSSLHDIHPRVDVSVPLNHHYETPANSNPRPPKPPRAHLFPGSLDVNPISTLPLASPPGTIDRATVDQRNKGSFAPSSLPSGDYDIPWDKKQKEINLLHHRLLQKPRQQDLPVVPRDKVSPPMDQKKSERKMCRTPTPDDSISKHSIGSETSSPVGSLGSIAGSHFDQRHTFSNDLPTVRSHHSRPLPAPPIPVARRPSPSPGGVQTHLPLEEQPWYKPTISRLDAEKFLENQPDFSFVVRNSESCRTDYSLSIRDKSPNGTGYIHLRIELADKGYVLGQFSSAFPTVSECIAHYTRHRLTIRGAEHKRLNVGAHA